MKERGWRKVERGAVRCGAGWCGGEIDHLARVRRLRPGRNVKREYAPARPDTTRWKDMEGLRER